MAARVEGLGQTVRIELSNVLGQMDDGGGGTEVGGHVHGCHVGVALSEGQDVADRRAPPLVDGLVVVAYDGDVSARLCKEGDELFLNRVDVLILVYHHVLDALLEHRLGLRPFVLARLKAVHHPAQEFGVVEDRMVVEKFAILVKRRQCVLGHLLPIQLVLSQHIEHGMVVSNVPLPPFEGPPGQVFHRGQTRFVRISLNQQLRLDLVHHPVLEELIEVRLHELKTPSVNRSDVHLHKPRDGHALSLDGSADPVMQFTSRFFREGERHDAAGRRALAKQAQDALHEHLGLARTGARNDLQVTTTVVNRLLLSGSERHQTPPPNASVRESCTWVSGASSSAASSPGTSTSGSTGSR